MYGPLDCDCPACLGIGEELIEIPDAFDVDRFESCCDQNLFCPQCHAGFDLAVPEEAAMWHEYADLPILTTILRNQFA
jgi:hypothetical protein